MTFEPTIVKPRIVPTEDTPPGGIFCVNFPDGCGFWVCSDGALEWDTDGVAIKFICSHGLEIVYLVEQT